MSDAVPVYLVGPSGGRLAAVSAALGGAAESIAADDAADTLAGRPPGVAVFDTEGLGAGWMLGILSALSEARWTTAVITDEEPPSLRTVSLGAPDALPEVRRHIEDPPSAPGCLLGLDRALAEISRVRHDLNNPLSAAMAEAQLLLMDAPGDEDRESLDVILEQLRRMRDMLHASRHLRPRRELTG